MSYFQQISIEQKGKDSTFQRTVSSFEINLNRQQSLLQQQAQININQELQPPEATSRIATGSLDPNMTVGFDEQGSLENDSNGKKTKQPHFQSAPTYTQQPIDKVNVAKSLTQQESKDTPVTREFRDDRDQYQADIRHVNKVYNQWQTEEEKTRWKRLIFNKLKKYCMLRSLDRQLKLSDNDLQKYIDNWESKMPEPIMQASGYNINNYQAAYSAYQQYHYTLQQPYSKL